MFLDDGSVKISRKGVVPFAMKVVRGGS